MKKKSPGFNIRLNTPFPTLTTTADIKHVHNGNYNDIKLCY